MKTFSWVDAIENVNCVNNHLRIFVKNTILLKRAHYEILIRNKTLFHWNSLVYENLWGPVYFKKTVFPKGWRIKQQSNVKKKCLRWNTIFMFQTLTEKKYSPFFSDDIKSCDRVFVCSSNLWECNSFGVYKRCDDGKSCQYYVITGNVANTWCL